MFAIYVISNINNYDKTENYKNYKATIYIYILINNEFFPRNTVMLSTLLLKKKTEELIEQKLGAIDVGETPSVARARKAQRSYVPSIRISMISARGPAGGIAHHLICSS